MSGPGNETLTAALRRLADERASGLLSVATPGHDVVIEIDAGTPVAIGPDHDASGLIGEDATAEVVAVAVVDELVDRLVAAIVTGDSDWTWDVASDVERRAIPAGLTQELARRAVDAAQALAALDPDDVLEPAHAVTTTGELDRVRQLFDGQRTIADVAEVAAVALPTVATMAASLVAGGALALDQEELTDGEPTAMSWTDTVAAADDEDDEDDEDDDEPELWVMDPPEDDEDGSVAHDEPAVRPAPARRLAPTPLRDVAAPPDGPDPDPTTESAAAPDESVGPAAAATDARGASSETQGDPGWNDTSWLDELSPSEGDSDSPPVLAAGGDDERDALGSMLNDLDDDELFGDRSSRGTDEESGASDADTPLTVARREPRAEPADVAEFLRELSRLALDDD